jgi:hypothetical protein
MSHFISTQTFSEPVLMRPAIEADAARIGDLARLDDKRLPAGPFLVAELGGSIVAAVSVSTGAAVADPFRHTADAVAMLRLRSAQVAGGSELAGRRARRPSSEQTRPAAIAA